MEKLGQEPAFSYLTTNWDYKVVQGGVGMSKRFYTATLIAQGLLSSQLYSQITQEHYRKDLVEQAYKITDELLEQETK